MLTQLWSPTHAAHSTTGIFTMAIRPNPIESAVDLWRMDTQYEYVKGEEQLSGWTPRGISLIRDFVDFRKQQIKAADVEATKSVFGNEGLALDGDVSVRAASPLTQHQKEILHKFVRAWQNTPVDPSSVILSATNIEPPKDGAAFAAKQRVPQEKAKIPVSASVQFQEKNPVLLKSGYLLTPDPSQSRWVRRYLELRRPYLHVHSVPDGDELNAINLHDSRVDHQPQVAKLFQRSSAATSQLNVFAIYARQNAFIFATRSDREKLEWVMRLDESFLYNNGIGSIDGSG